MLGLPICAWLGETFALYLEFLIVTPVVLWAAQPFFHRRVDINQFGIWPLGNAIHWLKCHAADGPGARPILDDLWIHRAGKLSVAFG